MVMSASWKAAAVCLAWAGVACAAANQTFEFKQQSTLPDGWKAVSGSWSIVDGKLQGTATVNTEAELSLGDNGRDIAVEASLAFVPGKDATRWFAIVIRDKGAESPGVQFTVRQDTSKSNGVEIASRWPAPQQGYHVMQTRPSEKGFSDNGTHRVRVEAAGPWIRGYLDDKLVVRSYRGDEFAGAGNVALRLSRATIMIDQIRTYSIEKEASDAIRTRPLVIAHRGWSFIAPENTLASYKQAMKTGADMAECDVYLTKDKQLILLHDHTFQRTTGTKAKPADLTLAEIKKLDAGSWKSPEYNGEPVPTLVETLQLLKDKLRLVIELKEDSIAAPAVEAIKQSGTEPQDVMIFSFYAKAVEEIAKIEPLLPTTWLIDDPGLDVAGWRATIHEALRIRASAIGTSLPHVDPGFVKLAHACGLSVFVWTVDEPQDMAYLVRVGVDAIISNRPDVVVNLLDGK